MVELDHTFLVWFTAVTSLLFFTSAYTIHTPSKVTNNPADQLVAVLKDNRTAHHLSTLYSSPGLACIALQYIKAYEGNCDAVGGPKAKKPEESAFAEKFAPNCNVEPSTLTEITGRFIGCQSEYLKPDRAFSELLMKDNKSLSILYSKNHTEVGAAVSGSDGGSPYFWCVLFSNGKSNNSFVLKDGVAKVSRPGCFSGANDECSSAEGRFQPYYLLRCVLTVLIVIGFGVGV